MHYNTVFLSDLHIGSKKCYVRELIEFLENNTFEELYLVGDIVDIWRLKQGLEMKRKKQMKHIRAIELLIHHASEGTKIHYVCGNHDSMLRQFMKYSGVMTISLCDEAVYTDSNGKQHLVMHGDQFDFIVKYNQEWVGKLGDRGYDILIALNYRINQIRSLFGFRHFSMSKYIKIRVKKITNFLDKFESVAVKHAKNNDCDGIICGHWHDPKHTENYLNLGCWTDKENLNFAYDNGSGLVLTRYNTEDE